MMKNLVKTLLICSVFGILFWTCTDDTKTLDAKTDAYILKRGNDIEQKFALGFLVSANKEIKTAAVKTPANVDISLEKNAENSFIFLIEPLLTDFSSQMPVLGEYLFEVHSSEDEIFQATDQVSYDNLSIPVITKAEYKPDSKTLELEWDPVANASGFAVKVTRPNGTVVYVSFSLDWDATKYTITSEHGNWITPPAIGQNYLLEVHAFVYEDDVQAGDEVYNLKEISIGTHEIVWGQ